MKKITFEEFRQVVAYDLNGKANPCMEIWFRIDGCIEYQDSWLGKMADHDTKKDVFWFGLTPDGSQAYEYDIFEDFANAKVFYGSKSLKEIWNSISILSLGGGTVDEMLPYYLGL